MTPFKFTINVITFKRVVQWFHKFYVIYEPFFLHIINFILQIPYRISNTIITIKLRSCLIGIAL